MVDNRPSRTEGITTFPLRSVGEPGDRYGVLQASVSRRQRYTRGLFSAHDAAASPEGLAPHAFIFAKARNFSSPFYKKETTPCIAARSG